MSYAVGKPQASSPSGNDGPPSTATVYDFICLFTHDLRRKQKRWQDGKLKYHSFNKKVMVYDDRGHLVGESHWDQQGDLAPGDEFSLDRGMALVQVEDCTGEKQQDLTDLLDKRAREVEKRRQIAAAKTRPPPRGSLAGGAQPPPQQRPHLPLSSLVQSPGPIGRAAIPAHSPFEARHQRLHQDQPPSSDARPAVAERPPPAKKRRASPSPPSKAGFARNLFGTTLNLSSCPGPELLAAKARALRQRMLSQADASSTPQEDEATEAQAPVQSSPLFVQDEPEATPSRPAKEQRSTLQPVTRHPIASARSVMREAEEAGNRHVESAADDEKTTQQENAPKRKSKATRTEPRTAAVDLTTQDADLEEPVALEKSSKRKRKEKELSQSRQPLQTKEALKQKPTATRRLTSPDPMMIDEPDEAEEALHRQKAHKESQRKKKEREKAPPQPPVPVRTEAKAKAKEPRTTLRMRSRQKRGLLMLREPSSPPPEPPAPVEEGLDDRIAKTPSPEPSAPPPQRIRSASPEEVIIPSSAPPVEDVAEPAPVDHIPTPVLPESSSEDDLPQTFRCRAPKRRTCSPPPEPDVSEEEEPTKKTRRRTTKRAVYEGTAREQEQDSQPRKRRATKRAADNDDQEDDEGEEAPETQGPRIAKLPRKGIRSREIIGYVAQGIETLIPGPFASGSFRLGGPPVTAVESAAPAQPAMVESAPEPISALPVELAPAVSSPMEEKPKATTADSAPESIFASPKEAAPAAYPPIAERLAEAAIVESATESIPSPLIEPVPAASFPIEKQPNPTTVDRAPESTITPPIQPAPAVSSPVEEKPTLSSPPAPEEAAVASTVMTTTYPTGPARPQAVVVSEAAEAILAAPVSRRHATPKAPPSVVRSNSASNAVTATTTEANETKLGSLSAPEIALAEVPVRPIAQLPENAPVSESEKKLDVILEAPLSVPIDIVSVSETTSSGSETGRPRIANPASRGKKAARREDAAGLAPQVMVPLEPVQPLVRMIGTRPGGRARVAAAGPLALGPVAPPPPPPAGAPVVAKKAASNMPGFTSASGGTWSRHAHDLLGMNRPERR